MTPDSLCHCANAWLCVRQVIGNILGALVHSIEQDSRFKRFVPLLKRLHIDKSKPAGDKCLQYLLACELYGGLIAVCKPAIEVFVRVQLVMSERLSQAALAKYGPGAFTLAVEEVKADACLSAAMAELFASGASVETAAHKTLVKELCALMISKFFNTEAKVTLCLSRAPPCE